MAIKNREYLKNLLEKQIINDFQNGDTTVLAEIISQFADDTIFNWLTMENQSIANLPFETQSDISLKISKNISDK